MYVFQLFNTYSSIFKYIDFLTLNVILENGGTLATDKPTITPWSCCILNCSHALKMQPIHTIHETANSKNIEIYIFMLWLCNIIRSKSGYPFESFVRRWAIKYVKYTDSVWPPIKVCSIRGGSWKERKVCRRNKTIKCPHPLPIIYGKKYNNIMFFYVDNYTCCSVVSDLQKR